MEFVFVEDFHPTQKNKFIFFITISKIALILTDRSINNNALTNPIENKKEAKRELSKRKILQAALQLFGEQGFHSTSISHIAKTAGISKGLMYNYFESKEALIEGIFDMLIKDYENQFILDMSRSPQEALSLLIKEGFDLMQKEIKLCRLITILSLQKFEYVQQFALSKMSNYYILLSKIFEDLGHAEPLKEARELCALMDGIALQYMIVGENFPLEDFKEFMIQRYTKNNKTDEEVNNA